MMPALPRAKLCSVIIELMWTPAGAPQDAGGAEDRREPHVEAAAGSDDANQPDGFEARAGILRA
jgi:hypothetical protein